MQKRMLKRILAGFCTVAMLSQTILETGIAAYAADGTENGIVSEEETEDEEALSEEAAVSEDTSAETVSEEAVKEAAPEEEEAVEEEKAAEAQSEKTEAPEDEEEEEEAPEADGDPLKLAFYLKDNKVYVGSKEYGTFSGGVFTINSNIATIPENTFSNWVAENVDANGNALNDLTSVKFAENSIASSIRERAFQSCTKLTNVDLRNAVDMTTIYSQAFNRCGALTSLLFNEMISEEKPGLQYINNGAFSECSSLTEITLTSGLIRVEDNAFSRNSKLKTIRIKSKDTVFKPNCFSECAIEDLVFEYDNPKVIPEGIFQGAGFAETADIIIPPTVQEIKQNAFRGSTIPKITLAADGDLSTIANNAFTDCKKLVKFSAGNENGLKLTDAITEIGDEAFKACAAITKADLNKAEKIGNSAFAETGITDLTFSNASGENFGKSIFKSCISLQEVHFPSGRKVVAEEEFWGCNGLQTIDFSAAKETLVEIKANAFNSCFALENVVLPHKITVIPAGCFAYCPNLKTVNYYDLAITGIGNGAFIECHDLVSSVLPVSLQTIGNQAFFNCYNLCTNTGNIFIIPENVAYIGDEAFRKDEGIKKIIVKSDIPKGCGPRIFADVYIKDLDLDGVTKIADNLFCEATFIANHKLRIPDSAIEIGKFAFCGADQGYNGNIVSIDLNQVKKIDEGAFKFCQAVEEITLPDTLEEIGREAFYKCIKLQRIDIPENVTKMEGGCFAKCSNLSEIYFNAAAVTSCGTNNFAECNIKKIEIGDKVTVFPDHLFEGAHFSTQSSGKYDMVSLFIPKSVTVFGSYSLSNVVNIEYLYFEEGSALSEIKDHAFYQMGGLKKIGWMTGRNGTVIEGRNDFPEHLTKIWNNAFDSCVNYEGPVVFSEGFLNLGNDAFRNCTLLSAVSLPVSLEVLGDRAYDGCTALSKLTYNCRKVAPDNPGDVFRGCTGLKTVEFGDQVERIPGNLLRGITTLEKVELPESVTEIGAYAFAGCAKLGNTFKIPSRLTMLGDHAFSSCIDLVSVNIPGTLKRIGNNAFENCTALEKVTIADGVETIGGECFKGCTGLKEVSIPASVHWIENNAFIKEECTNTLFLVIPGSDAAKWLEEHGFMTSSLKEIHYVVFRQNVKNENPTGYKEGDTAELLPASCDGCIFRGWYLDPEFKNQIYSLEGMTGDFTVYAKWEIIRYSITYVLDGGINNDSNPNEYTVDDNIRLKKATKDGYSWGGWFTDAGFTQPIETIKHEPGTELGDLTLYAKFVEGAATTVSAFDNKPVISADADVQDLWLVQGQKFTMETGWTLENPKADKRYVSLSNKGAFKAKKVTVAPVVLVKGDRKINVTIVKPDIEKKFTIVHDEDNNESRKVKFTYDAEHLNAYWYSAAPDVAVVDQDGTVTAVGKGKAKITAYIYGCAYNCTVTVTEQKTENRTLHVNVDGSKSVSLTKANKPVWSIDDTTKAINRKNKVTGKAPGHAVLTAVMKDGSSYTVAVTVEDITLKTGQPAKGKNKYNLTMKAGENIAMAFASVEQEVVFKSSKPDVAYVDEDGWVVAKTAGKTKLTTKINGKTVTVNVVVTP